jgi:hypothetical protein
MEPKSSTPPSPLETITIRPAYGDDQRALRRLAALDSATGVPPAPLLIAEVDDELRAALSLSEGSVIADPFYPTLDLIALLRTHAAANTSARARPRYRLGRRFRLQYA